MKTNRKKGISMDLPPHTRYKRCHFFIFLTSCLAFLPSGWGKGTPSYSFLNEEFENPVVYTIQENWGIWYMVKTMKCSLLKPPALSRARWLCYFQHCSCCPNSASRTDAKWLCPLALACRLNLMPQCNYTSRSLTTTSYGLETDPATFLSYGLQESHSLWDWAALFPFTSKPPLRRLPRSPVQHWGEWGFLVN